MDKNNQDKFKIVDNYILNLKTPLGKGSFGLVYSAID
jgi:hypothetical protein